ncbi:MAG: ABC transporter permease [Verrucomicrobia bacterium]|nr:ABC transporter permease [Verrucomicrobiota bacterium]
MKTNLACSHDKASVPGGNEAAGHHLIGLALAGLRFGPGFILAALVLTLGLSSPYFFTARNLGNVLAQTATIAVLAMGQHLVILTRGIDLSVGSVLALSSVAGALVYREVHSSAVVIASMLGTGLAAGFINGFVYVWGRLPHPFIVTLATLSIARGLALELAGGAAIPGMPATILFLGGGSIGGVPTSALVAGGVALVLAGMARWLVWGRWIYSVGGNPDAARRVGIPMRGVLLSVYMICGITAGIGAVLTSGRTAAGSPLFGNLAELDSIAAVIIGGASFLGGRGHIGNALTGALMIGVIRNALNLLNVDIFFQLIAIGIIIVLAVEADVLRGRLEERFRMIQSLRVNQ